MDLVEDAAITFSWYDYILFTGMLGASALIGIYFGCFGSKQSTANEYLLGGKKMAVFPISMSLVASHISGITILALPADVYRFGAAYWNMTFSFAFVVLCTMYVFLPVFFKLQITSIYEYLERRFDNRNRALASFLFALSQFLYLPIVIYIPALAFSAATGVNVHLITPLVCGVCIFYTTIGGLKAVVWTDTLQFTIIIGAVLTVVYLGIREAGGIPVIWQVAKDGGRLDIFDFDPNPTKRDSFWSVFLGLTAGWISLTSINQGCVQKFMSMPSLSKAKQAVLYYSVGVIGLSSFSIFTGLILYAKYAGCDPFTTGAVQRNDQLLPYYVLDVAKNLPGLPGVFIAGVFCAALSTLSASLNCLSGTVYEDFIGKILNKRRKPSEITTGRILKAIVLVIGTICMALVFVIEHLGGILPLAISLGGVTGGPLLGMFTLGVLIPMATSRGSFYGALSGLLFAGWVVVMAQYYQARGALVYQAKPTSIANCTRASISANFTSDTFLEATSITLPFPSSTLDPLPLIVDSSTNEPFVLFRISYYYYCLLGASITVILGVIISYFDKSSKNAPPINPDLLSPVIHCFLKRDPTKREHVRYNGIVGNNTTNSNHIVVTEKDRIDDV